MIKKITIIGVGLIGGSLAKAIKKNNLAEVVFGFGRNLSRLESAQKSNIIDQHSIDISEALDGASIVVIATPVGTFESLFRELKPYITKGMIITDVGSTKTGIAQAAREILVEMANCFVPAHPIAGKEKSGFESSDALAEELQSYVKKRLSAHAYPRILEFSEQLPKTPSGKIQRFLLRQNAQR